MDTFFEQIVLIRRTPLKIALFVGMWLLCLGICAILFLFNILGTFNFIIIAGLIYGAYKLSGKFYVEYEYIVTNSTMDIDKIIGKSSRKRMASFDISDIELIEKYNPAAPKQNFKNIVIACNETDEDVYKMVVTKEGKGNTLIVFSPNEKVKGALIKFLPKFIANSAFK